jgi:nucleotide-binding universal stress UspA family protein
MEMALFNRASLIIAHAVESPSPLSFNGSILPRAYEELEAALRSHATRKLRSLLARATKRGVKASALLLHGPPHLAISRAIRSHHVDLVVIGTHGRTGARRFLIGSVASRIVATSRCPVLTVRGR